ncbi:MAG: hypothetical protein ACKOWJ_04915 [Micrococcales bacterium]
MADFEHEFPVVLRGYEREAVEDAIRDMRRELLTLSAQNAQLATELREASNRLLEVEGQLTESQSPSYAGVGAKAALILSTSEEQAKRLVLEAETEANAIRKSIEEEVADRRREAQDYYESLVAEAQRRADRIINSATVEFESTVAEGKNRSAEIVDEAVREAGSIRGAIATEVAKMRASTKRETEALRAKVDRDLAERKMITQREISQQLDYASALALISDQARSDLELELTARRADAEATYLRKHQEAVAATQRYLDDANAQLQLAMTRANAARMESETLEAAARAINQKLTEETRAKVDAMLAAAEAESRQIIERASAEAVEMLRESEIKLRRLEVERESVGQYVNNLKQVFERLQSNLNIN